MITRDDTKETKDRFLRGVMPEIQAFLRERIGPDVASTVLLVTTDSDRICIYSSDVPPSHLPTLLRDTANNVDFDYPQDVDAVWIRVMEEAAQLVSGLPRVSSLTRILAASLLLDGAVAGVQGSVLVQGILNLARLVKGSLPSEGEPS